MKDAISSHVYKSFQLGHLKPYQIPLRRPFIMLFAFISNFISIYKHKWFKLAWWSTDKHYHIVKPYKEEIQSSYSYQWCIQIILWIEKKPAQWEISNSTLIPYIEHLHFYDTVPLHLYYCRELILQFTMLIADCTDHIVRLAEPYTDCSGDCSNTADTL